MKMTTIQMDWSDTGCDMTVQLSGAMVSLQLACPVCGVVVLGHHQCGDRLPKPPKKRATRRESEALEDK
jgi:hypothetical protein